MDKNVLAKFECRVELNEWDGGKSRMYVFYNEAGKYIGDVGWFKKCVIDREIMPETVDGGKVCSIGYSLKDGKWYGWSHRAIYGFEVGDVVKEGDCCASSGYTEEHLKDHSDPDVLPVGFEAKTDADCKKMAIAFAESVG